MRAPKLQIMAGASPFAESFDETRRSVPCHLTGARRRLAAVSCRSRATGEPRIPALKLADPCRIRPVDPYECP
jgi:hypothetical protein